MSMHQDVVYLDYAAATPVDTAVLARMQPYYSELFYNPSATYSLGRQTKAALEAARASVAQTIGARPSEIIFTAGGTEANNLAIHGALTGFTDGQVLVSSVEHESVLHPAERHEHALIPVDATGRIDLVALKGLITEQTVMISVMYANNEVGTVQPLRDVVRLADEVRRERHRADNDKPLYVHTDACQAGNYLDLHVARLGVDMMTLNGGKLYGPKQSGVLYVASHVRLAAQITGGGQERGLRSGTENVAQAVGFAASLEAAQQQRPQQAHELQQLQQYFLDELTHAIPSVVINGSRKWRLPNNVHITIPGSDNERLLFALDERGVIAAAGSACSASNEEPSHVLRAMGIRDSDAQASLRFTMGRTTDRPAIDRAVAALVEALQA